MTTVAIICEYNPFHLGHAYQIEKIRSEFGEDTCIIALMSGNFVQRGTPAIFDKYARAKAALEGGVNLVLEYPFPFCSSGANYFAKYAVKIINSLDCVDYLSFGTETGNLKQISQIADAITSETYEQLLKSKLLTSNKNLGFAEIRESILLQLCPEIPPKVYRSPNNILAIEYLVALKKENSKIVPHTVKRTIDYHASTLTENGVASASYIRELLSNGNLGKALASLPEKTSALYQSAYLNGFWVDQNLELCSKLMLSHFRLVPYTDLCFECTEELMNRIYNSSQKAKNYFDLIKFSQAAHFTKARVQRAILHAWLGTPKDFCQTDPQYTQLLAADENGMTKLKQIHRCGTIKVLTKPAATHLLCPLAKKQADFCAKADSIYSLLQPSLGAGDEFFRKSPYCVR